MSPRLGFVPGLAYRARLEDVELIFTMPGLDSGEAPRVQAIYPSSAEVPENLLRLYVHFSRPMRAKDVHRHVRLYDHEGREVELPFVEIESGLWDPGRHRLTLLFHPGRIKRGVGPNLALGPPLRAGRSYRIVVNAEMRDEGGRALETGFEKELRVVAPDRRSPRPQDWKVTPPETPRSPLRVEFDEPLDHALLLRWIRVERISGEEVAGEATAEPEERGLLVVPSTPWTPGSYRIIIHPEIEDLAGNTPARLFDFEPDATGPERSEPIVIPFEVR